MREHRYRAWDTVKKVMYSAEELGQDQETLSVDGRGFVNVSGDSTRLSRFHTHLLPLEYTGLKGKNGKEIYEGDIVQASSLNLAECYICRWNEDFASFEFEGKYKNRLDDWVECELGGGSYNNIEVIGNIYENKELLDGKD